MLFRSTSPTGIDWMHVCVCVRTALPQPEAKNAKPSILKFTTVHGEVNGNNLTVIINIHSHVDRHTVHFLLVCAVARLIGWERSPLGGRYIYINFILSVALKSITYRKRTGNGVGEEQRGKQVSFSCLAGNQFHAEPLVGWIYPKSLLVVVFTVCGWCCYVSIEKTKILPSALPYEELHFRAVSLGIRTFVYVSFHFLYGIKVVIVSNFSARYREHLGRFGFD